MKAEDDDRLLRLLDDLQARNAKVAGAVVAERREGRLDIAIAHGRLKLTGLLRPFELAIVAGHAGECWDYLLSIEAAPEQVGNGWVCRLCDGDRRSTFPSLDVLLIDHLYQPFAAWIEEELLPSVGLALFRREGAMWAKLVRSEDEIEGASCVILV